MKQILVLFEQYVIDLPCCMFHELSHWILAFLNYLMGFNTFPIIKINEFATCSIDDETDLISTYSHRMYVTYRSNVDGYNFQDFLVTLMPAFTTILLFIFSPWYMWIYYLCNISTLWLSVGDMKQIRSYLNIKQ